MIKTDQLTVQYGTKRTLDNLSVQFNSGSIIGLLGPNGSGKTTLIKVLAGLIREYEGKAMLMGEAPGPKTKAMVSYLPDRIFLNAQKRPIDYLIFYSDFFQDFDQTRAKEVLRYLGIDEYREIKTMSKGMREKVQLVLVMSRNAKIYLLDEPMAAVDPATRGVLLDTLIKHHAKGSTLLIATHLIQEIEPILSSILFLKKGQSILVGSRDEIVEREQKTINEIFREVFKCQES